MLAMLLGMSNQLPEPLQAALVTARLSIVLVEPIAGSLPDLRFLLSNDSYRVTSVTSIRNSSYQRHRGPCWTR
jgi:hypothetical protein